MQMIVLTATVNGNGKRQLTGKEIQNKLPIAEVNQRKLRTGKDSLRHWENIEPILRKIIAENNGDLPSSGWLKKNGYGYVTYAIYEYYGKFHAVRERLGLVPRHKKNNNPLAQWENLDPILRKLVKKHGDLPGGYSLNKKGLGNVVSAIHEYHGGFKAVREKLGLEQKVRVGADSLEHWKNVKPILKKLVKKHGDLPSDTWLRENGRNDVSIAIHRYHNGFPAVREKLGLAQKGRFGKDALRHWENLEPILKKLITEHGDLPSSGWFKNNGQSSLAAAIVRHNGGFSAVRKKLGLEPMRKVGVESPRHWENLEPVLKKIIEKHGDLPSAGWFIQNKLSGLSSAIIKYHGGFPAVREKLRSLGILKDIESDAQIFAKLKGAMGAEGRMD